MKKLYKVQCVKPSYKFYVVAESFDKAKELVRTELDKRDYGFSDDRHIESIELVGHEKWLTATGTFIYTPLILDK